LDAMLHSRVGVDGGHSITSSIRVLTYLIKRFEGWLIN